MRNFLDFLTKPFESLVDAFVPSYPEIDANVGVKKKEDMLADRLRRLQEFQAKRRRQRRSFIGLGALAMVAGPLLSYAIRHELSLQSPLTVVPVLYGLVILVMAASITPSEAESEIRQVEDELDLVQSESAGQEERAQKLFKLHQFELKRYYDQTLRQSKWIFIVGICCLVLGFSVIGASLWFANQRDGRDKIIVAVLGGIGGILSNFIAVVYLKMHSQTIQSLTEFHNRLVLTHYLHFGNFLLAKIETQDLREKSLAQMALNLSTNQKHASKTPSNSASRQKKGKPRLSAALLSPKA